MIVPDELLHELLDAQGKMLDDWAETKEGSVERQSLWSRLHYAAHNVELWMDDHPERVHEHDQVAEFHEAFGVISRKIPDNTTVGQDEQLLRAKLVLEEAFEFAAAMGVVPCDIDGEEIEHSHIQYEIYQSIDLVEAADALADTLYVVYGSAHTLGLPIREVFAEVHRSNMAKLGPDGKPIYREGDSKVLKPEGWTKPDILGVLFRA